MSDNHDILPFIDLNDEYLAWIDAQIAMQQEEDTEDTDSEDQP